MLPTFHVWAKWDDEVRVWYTAETTIRGLNSSGATLEELRERLMLLIPDFLKIRCRNALSSISSLSERTS